MITEALEKYLSLVEKGIIDLNDIEMLLSAEEKTVLNILKKKRVAMNINEIRNAIVDEFLELLRYYKKLALLHEKQRKAEFDLKRTTVRDAEIKKSKWEHHTQELREFESKKPVITCELDYIDSYGLFKELEEHMEKEGLSPYTITEADKRKVASLLKKIGIVSIPAYSTIERILNELEASGLVISRQGTGGKKLYAINPLILKSA